MKHLLWSKDWPWTGLFRGPTREGKNAAIDHQRRNERTSERDQPLTSREREGECCKHDVVQGGLTDRYISCSTKNGYFNGTRRGTDKQQTDVVRLMWGTAMTMNHVNVSKCFNHPWRLWAQLREKHPSCFLWLFASRTKWLVWSNRNTNAKSISSLTPGINSDDHH